MKRKEVEDVMGEFGGGDRADGEFLLFGAFGGHEMGVGVGTDG